MKWQVKNHSGAQRILQPLELIIGPQNNVSGEPELNNVGDKSQDKNKLILHKNIINAR